MITIKYDEVGVITKDGPNVPEIIEGVYNGLTENMVNILSNREDVPVVILHVIDSNGRCKKLIIKVCKSYYRAATIAKNYVPDNEHDLIAADVMMLNKNEPCSILHTKSLNSPAFIPRHEQSQVLWLDDFIHTLAKEIQYHDIEFSSSI